MADAFWLGLLVAHFGYGVVFFLIGCKLNRVPSIIISAIAILFWPLMVHHIMTRHPSPDQERP